MGEKKEFRISLPNEPGQIARVCEALGRRGVNILSVAAIGAASPVVALVADQEDKTGEALKELGISYQELELLTVDLPHQPGALGSLARKMGDANINIDSIYLLWDSSGDVKVALTVSDPNQAKQELGQ